MTQRGIGRLTTARRRWRSRVWSALLLLALAFAARQVPPDVQALAADAAGLDRLQRDERLGGHTLARLVGRTDADRRVAAELATVAGTVVSGTVSGSDQGFLTGASIVIDGPVHREGRTDADGRFTFTDVTSGRYRLLVAAEGYVPLDRTMDVGSASVSMDIVLLRIPSLP